MDGVGHGHHTGATLTIDYRRCRMDDRLVPMEMTLTECAAVNWVLSRVKEKVLTGVPSGVVIDQAISEALDSATRRSPS